MDTLAAPRLLLVEDEPEIRRFVRLALQREGCAVVEAGRLDAGLAAAGEHKPDLVVLDLGLPDGDGLDFIAALRGWSTAPVIVLSARLQEDDKIAALDAGADDYLVKPFGTGELLARVRAQLRRRGPQEAAQDAKIRFGEVVIDLARRTVERAGQPVHLTPIEYKLLMQLAQQPDRVVTHRQLLRNVWGPSHADDAHYLRVYMGHLRAKLEAEPSKPRHLITELGVGYRFVA